ncbi:MAG: zf-HC2 domain-containing protein [Candidatus Krumholzibacteria bacterium]|nr:zf-HC2 domain-containing protein [Candidatus Krumholzibacteria bacterium]
MRPENNCTWVRERIDPHLDGELRAGDAERLERHVAGCAACAREVELARRVVAELRALPTHGCPDAVVARVEALVAGIQTPAQGRLARARAWRTAVFARPAMTVMLVAIAAVTVFVLTQRHRVAGPAGERYTQAEVEAARGELMVAFAYVGKYSRMTGSILREEMDEGLVEPLDRAMTQAGGHVVEEVLVKPVGRAVTESQKEILETMPADGRSR